jgi:hypothetical protein
VKKKPLADHRPQARNAAHHQPMDDEAKELKEKYGFAPDFGLMERLKYGYSSAETAKSIADDIPKLSEQRKHLEELMARCEALREVLSALGVEERRLLLEAFPDLPLSRLGNDTRCLQRASRDALVSIEDERNTRQWQEHVWNFVWHLADVWEEGTGRKATCNYSGSSQSFVGAFYRFVNECAGLGSIKLASFGDSGSLIPNILQVRRLGKKRKDNPL